MPTLLLAQQCCHSAASEIQEISKNSNCHNHLVQFLDRLSPPTTIPCKYVPSNQVRSTSRPAGVAPSSARISVHPSSGERRNQDRASESSYFPGPSLPLSAGPVTELTGGRFRVSAALLVLPMARRCGLFLDDHADTVGLRVAKKDRVALLRGWVT